MRQTGILTDELLQKICDDLRLGLSEREVCEAAGIEERTWYMWKARARSAQSILPEDWQALKYEEMLACAQELEIGISGVRRTGRNSRLTRRDLIAALTERAARHVAFLRAVEAAAKGTDAKRSLLTRIDDLVQGRVKIRQVKTVETVVTEQEDGSTTVAEVTTKVIEVNPLQAAFRMLEMRWPEEYGKRSAGTHDPEATAKDITGKVRAMMATVPGPPPQAALPPASAESESEP